MPYLISVGLFKGNKGAQGARGWHIRRRKNVVRREFGPVAFVNRRTKPNQWAAAIQLGVRPVEMISES
jgi:hypothetical protein